MCELHARLDHIKAEAFAGKMLESFNRGGINLMLSIGHRTGLFDILEALPPSNSRQIAAEAGLNERYVREWLNALVAGRIIHYDAGRQEYRLPREHSAFLTRRAGADNVAVIAQYFSVLGKVEDRIVDCFRNGGGVPYREFSGFFDVMAEDSAQTVLSALFEHILPLVPGIKEKLENGISVLDVGCGSAKALLMMARTFPNSRLYGMDLCLDPILEARAEAEKEGLTNVVLKQQDLTDYVHERKYDFITAFDAIHDQARPDLVLKGIFEALKPGGIFLMQDIAGSSHVENNLEHPLGALLYSISCMHCMTVSLAQEGMGLGTMWGEEVAEDMIREAGFREVTIERLPHDIMNCYYVIRK